MIRLFVDYDGSVSVVTAASVEEFKQAAQQLIGHSEDFRFTVEGQDIEECSSDDFIGLDNQIVQVEAVVLGGKGGFGSLLRIAAAQKKHFNNFDSARDSSGRRLRDIRNELRLMEFVKKKKREQQFINQELGEIANKPPESRVNTHNQAVAKVTETYGLKASKWEGHLEQSIRTALAKKRNKKSDLLEVAENTGHKEVEQETLEMTNQDTNLGKRSPLPRHVVEVKSKKSTKAKAEPEEISKYKSKSPNKKAKHIESPIKEAAIETHIPPLVGPVAPEMAALQFPPIDLQQLSSLQDFQKLDSEHLKHELKRLGLKCGGSHQERAQRLFEIKKDPSNLFNAKYLAKSK